MATTKSSTSSTTKADSKTDSRAAAQSADQSADDKSQSKSRRSSKKQKLEDSQGIPGQIQYEDAQVNAERAGKFAAGKVDTLFEDDEDNEATGWTNPADDNRSDEQREKNETEPEAMRNEPRDK